MLLGQNILKTDNIPCRYYCSNSFLKRAGSVKDAVKKPDPYGYVFLKAVCKKLYSASATCFMYLEMF